MMRVRLLTRFHYSLILEAYIDQSMASTSASFVQKSFKYDVFLSFRGEDTRNNFVDHLYYALQQKGIITYRDEERIKKGEKISDQLIRSIKKSRFFIIVFSKTYASSSWCLQELVKIMECQNTNEQTAYPIFYNVEPTEVRKQIGAVEEAFAEHIHKETAGIWRDALKEAADLAGWDLKNTFDGHEAKLIQKVVAEFSVKLSLINWSVDENLVGMETRVEDIVSSLEIGSEGVRMIGIKGMGGGGKTTLAEAVFDHVSSCFEGTSFVEHVREVSKGSSSGLIALQKKILKDLLDDDDIVVKSVHLGKGIMKKRLCSRKVLVVLDDVDDINQLQALAGKPDWFAPGSRIIITTRDEQVLVAHRVNVIHSINLLSDVEAICLFTRHAFERELLTQEYEELAGKVVSYADGLPLTIKVLGSFLCGRTLRDWEKAIERLDTIPLEETLKKLELSYDALEDELQQIFLDVACILKDEMKDEAIRVLESCGFHAEFGLGVLEQKSLITISKDGRLLLHDHLVEMGKDIVRRLHPHEPMRHNRLWIKEEIEDILINELGTEATICLKLEDSTLHPAIIMKGLRKMTGLRFLYVDTPFGDVDEDSQYLPDTLQSLHWPGYPLGCLPYTFQAKKLAGLAMVRGNICQLWEGGESKVLRKLKFLDLKHSNLTTFDLEMTLDLEMLDLRKCKDFWELHMPVPLLNLKFLNLSGSKVSDLNFKLTPHLEKLTLSIKEIERLPDDICMLKHMKYLNLKSCQLLQELPTDIYRLECLEELHLTYCSVLQDIPNSICMLKHLKYLKLTSCYYLKELPHDLHSLESLEELYLIDCISLQNLPDNVCNMKRLKLLHLPYCSLVKRLPEELGRLESLKELNIEGAGIDILPATIFRLKDLFIVWSRRRLEWHGFTSLKERSKYTASSYVHSCE